MTEQELHDLRVECYIDPTLYARTFKRHWFPMPMSWVHRGMLALLLRRADFLLKFGPELWPEAEWEWDQPQLEKILKYFQHDGKPLFVAERSAAGAVTKLHLIASRKTALMLPRGVGKTTIVNLANEMAIVYHDINFLVYLSETATHAEQQLRNVKRELATNEDMKLVFGDLVPTRDSKKKWKDDFIETTTGVTVAARGRGGQVRGLNVDAQRPDRIVVDDVEDKESVSTAEQLKKTRVWFHADVTPALPQMGKQGEIIVMGTMLHPEALLPSLIDDPEWVSATFGVLDPDDEPIAPFYMSKEQFDAKRNSAARVGMLSEFYMEYGSKLHIDPEERKFDISKIKYRILQRSDFLAVGMALDPAISESERADFASIAVVGMEPSGFLHVLDVWAKRGAHPREQIDQFFTLHFRWSPSHHGVETIAFQAALVHLLQEEMFRASRTYGPRAYFEVTKITHGRTRKDDRVEGILAPRYAAGYISHQAHFPELEVQLDSWPYGKKDVPDALAMAIALLDPFAASAAAVESWVGDEKSWRNPLVDDAYKPLDLELGEWRQCP